jgi:hypothetical protein
VSLFRKGQFRLDFFCLFCLVINSLHSIGAICATLRCRSSDSERLTRALSIYRLTSDPKFKHLERFLNNVRISIPSANGQRTKTIRGLIERTASGKFVFSKNDGQGSTQAIVMSNEWGFIISGTIPSHLLSMYIPY